MTNAKRVLGWLILIAFFAGFYVLFSLEVGFLNALGLIVLISVGSAIFVKATFWAMP